VRLGESGILIYMLNLEKTASKKRDFICSDAIARFTGGRVRIVLRTAEKALWLK
jgi:hypothetical protein